jgi:hypothetical protein
MLANHEVGGIYKTNKQTNSVAFSPQANYTDKYYKTISNLFKQRVAHIMHRQFIMD